MRIKVSNDKGVVESLVKAGYCPVECSIGGTSVVDQLNMDHHGDLSHLESVAIRAYRDHNGARFQDQRFVVAGVADADATFAVAALAGLLPEGLGELAETIAILDTDPVGRVVSDMPHGATVLAWNALYGGGRDDLAAAAGVQGWVTLTHPNYSRRIAPYIEAIATTAASEEIRLAEEARCDFYQRGYTRTVGGHNVLAIVGSTVFGFPTWYGRDDIAASGWKHPVVLALTEQHKNITIGCPNKETAEMLFGPGGLKNVFPKFQRPGWGGREAVGGSPRGEIMCVQGLDDAVRVVVEFLKERHVS